MGQEKITAITVGYGTGENHSNKSGMGQEKITATTVVTMLIHTCIYLEDTQLLLYAPLTYMNQKLYFHQK